MHNFMPKQSQSLWRPASSSKIHAKLKLNAPDDRYEREADAMADHIVGPSRRGTLGGKQHDRKCESVPAIVAEALTGAGKQLEPSICGPIEACFGHDFSKVRVHNDERSSLASNAVGALAYTAGNHIVFG